MTIFTVPGPHDHDALFEHAKGSIPSAMRLDRPFEDLHAAAAIGAETMAVMREFHRQTFIARAYKWWLDQHGKDREFERQEDETDAAYSIRIRSPQIAVTRVALLQLADAILAADGVAGTASMIEFPCDAAFMGEDGDSLATADLGFAFYYNLPDAPDGFGYPYGFLGVTDFSAIPMGTLLGVSCGASGFTIILPVGTPLGTFNAVVDMVRGLHAAGVLTDVQIASP